MKYFLLLFLSAILFSACSSSLELADINQEPCMEEGKITDDNTFAGITANNLSVMPSEDEVMVSVNIRSYCKSNLTMEIEQKDKIVNLKVYDKNTSKDNCVCVKRLNSTIKNLDSGTYTFRVLDRTGRQILDQREFTIY